MGDWTVKKYQKNLSINSPILIEGLPGIGNVGKVAVDYIIDQIKAKKIYSFFSYSMPHTVFINQNNLVELPEISIYHKRWHGKDYLFLAGDVQPVDEQGSYEFTDMILDIAQKFNVEEVITLGGIGMQDVPKQPKIYCTANTKKIVNKYKKGAVIYDKLYGVVGPIVGVSGIMVALAKKRKIDAISFLAETYGHPMYLGVKGAKEIIKLLNTKMKFNVNMKKLERDIKSLEEESKEIEAESKKSFIQKEKRKLPRYVDYIG